MNYISKVFSPKINLTRIGDKEIAEVLPATENFKTQNMDQGENTQAFTRSQGSSGVDLNNLADAPTGVRTKMNQTTEGTKSSTVNFIIDIPDGKNTKLQDAPHIKALSTSPQGKECFTVYISYLQEAFDTNKFLLCKESLELFTVIKGLAMPTNLFTSNEPIDLDRLHQFLSEVVQNKPKNNTPRQQPPMDFEERTALIVAKSSTYCDLVKTIQVFNSMISIDSTNAKQY